MSRAPKRRKTADANTATCIISTSTNNGDNLSAVNPIIRPRLSTTTALIGPGKKTYTVSRHLLALSSLLFRDAAVGMPPKQELVLHFPNLNALDFEDYLSWLSTRTLPLYSSNKQRVFADCIRLFNFGHELRDARLQSACVDEVLRVSRPRGLLPGEELLRELLYQTQMARLIGDLFLASYTSKKFVEQGGRRVMPHDFLMGLCEGLLEFRTVAVKGKLSGKDILPSFERACTWHVHDELFPASECEEEAGRREQAGKTLCDRTGEQRDWLESTADAGEKPSRYRPLLLRPQLIQHTSSELNQGRITGPKTITKVEVQESLQKLTDLDQPRQGRMASQYQNSENQHLHTRLPIQVGVQNRPKPYPIESVYRSSFSKDILLQEAGRRRSQLIQDWDIAARNGDHSKAFRIRNVEIPKIDAQIGRFESELKQQQQQQQQQHQVPTSFSAQLRQTPNSLAQLPQTQGHPDQASTIAGFGRQQAQAMPRSAPPYTALSGPARVRNVEHTQDLSNYLFQGLDGR